MMPFPIVVLISGQGSNLQAIIDAIIDGQINARIAAVISNKAEAFGLTRAQDAGIDTVVVDARANEDREQYDRRLAGVIDAYAPGLIVLAGFMRILSPEFVEHYPAQIINIHPSLLPKYPGLNTHQQVMENGDRRHGISIHFVTDVLDGGPLIAQASLTILPGDTLLTIKSRIHALEHTYYSRVIDWIAQGQLKLVGDVILLNDIPLPRSGYHFTS